MKLETLAIHAGYSPEPTTKAVAVPIYKNAGKGFRFCSYRRSNDLMSLF